MLEYVNVRASEILNQGELVAFLKSRFQATRPVGGRRIVEGTECVEVRVASDSPDFEEIRRFIDARRKKAVPGFSDLTIGWYLRKYTKAELQQAEVLRLTIFPHFEPCGEECGTMYETLCNECNWGRQVSDLILDTRRVPQHKDISETIAWVEWVVSSKFVRAITENMLTGAEIQTHLRVQESHEAIQRMAPVTGHGKCGWVGRDNQTWQRSVQSIPSQLAVSARALNSDLVSL